MQQGSSYIADASDPLEIARLLRQDRLATKYMGLFSQGVEVLTLRTILDIGCGPGGWALDVAQQYPHTHVVGIDIEPALIEAARGYAQAESTENVTFLQKDARQPLPFAEGWFDYIQIRFAQAFLNHETWKNLLCECSRVLRPGGTIRVADYEFEVSTSLANDQLADLLSRALWQTKRTFSQTGHSYGIAPALRQLLVEQKFVGLKLYAHAFDVSYQAEDFRGWFENFAILNRSIKNFLVKSGLISSEEHDRLFDRAMNEMQREGYCGVVFLLSWVARKP